MKRMNKTNKIHTLNQTIDCDNRLKVKKFKLTEETKTKKWVQDQSLNHRKKGSAAVAAGF